MRTRMMNEHIDTDAGIRVHLIDMVGSLSNAMDLISPAVVNHHKRVAFIAGTLAEDMGLSEGSRSDLIFAGLLHDVGAFSLKTRLDALEFETDGIAHANMGWRLLRGFPDLSRISTLVRHHHVPHRLIHTLNENSDIQRDAGILNLAGRIDTLAPRAKDLLPGGVMGALRKTIDPLIKQSGKMFAPDHLGAFLEIAQDPTFWDRMLSEDIFTHVRAMSEGRDKVLNMAEVLRFAELIAQVIDFRSRFTATHSRGVAASAAALAITAGFDSQEQSMMYLAGNLHDLGKLAVPTEILEKPAALTKVEFDIMRRHPESCYNALSHIPELDTVRSWAANHHERLNGNGYPQGLNTQTLDLGSRIMAVADVFTAVTEDRPYRAGMKKDQVVKVLTDMVHHGALDPGSTGLLLDDFASINDIRREAQAEAHAIFTNFYSESSNT